MSSIGVKAGDFMKKQKKKKREYQNTYHKFEIDFLKAEVLVAIGSTVLEAVRVVDPNYKSLTGLSQGQIDECDGLTIKGVDHYTLAICFPADADINVIVHECVHATNYIIDWYELPLDSQEDELQAYLTSFFVDRVIEALEQHKNENNTKEGQSGKKK